ncbi:hypothetical protein SAMN02745146_3371 [Hymenobacter daecheongensis DSM 21074]|uniref:Uncharacterized protein n=1 Tax=Hymenobacter daecheongensis DSM 21074 TaxID=1121955 RepID=A0A1M6K2T9_9BACT|nr:hypothetical protein [Hymenobacter daecheongensis]SHJ53258.1 hypothetical protein SAMN02745146_3371 [Hymenobacter daecheongensis DSM 21074]
MTLRLPLLLLSVLSAGCVRQHYFQSDARLSEAAGRPLADSARVTAGRHYVRGPVQNLFFGPHYRAVWATPVVLPVLNLRTAVPGGLQPGKMGGGFQSTSMTVNGANGRTYALRTLDKDPYKTLPKVMQKTFLLNIVRDATSAANPFGAFVVPPLAEAAGVPHTNPRPFYVRADETGLGASSPLFQGKVVMLEEKFDGKENLTPAFGSAEDLVDSDQMLRARYQQPTHQIDQLAFARARLLDIWLGDWDRHEGQWQWAVYQQAGRTRYRPIPKDRDQVFYRFDDGLIPWLVSRRWGVRKFRTFRPKYEDIGGLVKNARFIDERGLSEVTGAQFQQLATELQQRLTDGVIQGAVRRLPLPVYAREGAYTAATLQARRAALPAAARTFYQQLARHVTVAGTDAAERFVVQRLTDSTTLVSVYHLPDNDEKPLADSLLYRRLLRHAETKLLTLHGLDGEDEFEVSGEVARGLRVEIFGGPAADKLTDTSRVRHGSKKTVYHDTNRGNSVSEGPEVRDKTRKGVLMHAYDREGY